MILGYSFNFVNGSLNMVRLILLNLPADCAPPTFLVRTDFLVQTPGSTSPSSYRKEIPRIGTKGERGGSCRNMLAIRSHRRETIKTWSLERCRVILLTWLYGSAIGPLQVLRLFAISIGNVLQRYGFWSSYLIHRRDFEECETEN